MRQRPQSLAEVAQRSLDDAHFSRELSDFLHEFERYAGGPDALRMLVPTPGLLRGQTDRGAVWDAYLAATAAALAQRLKQLPPSWTRQPERFLHEPWYASPGSHMRALLLLESPGPFRERNLFVTANALSVA